VALATACCAVLAAAAAGGMAAVEPETPPTPSGELAGGYVLLVRHAEAEPDGADPELTEAGRRRAEALAQLLAGEELAAVLVTDTRRARATAAPVAARHGLVVEVYDPRRLADLAGRLRAREGNILVVGHSNTTPELVELLGGDPGEPIAHDEHDRLYRVEAASGETSSTRYASPPAGDDES
jgi:broad specificity phosphatase PhoE